MLVAYCRLCRHCCNLAEGGCLSSRFHFTHCRYFLGHVACRNLLWQGLVRPITWASFKGYSSWTEKFDFWPKFWNFGLNGMRPKLKDHSRRLTFSNTANPPGCQYLPISGRMSEPAVHGKSIFYQNSFRANSN